MLFGGQGKTFLSRLTIISSFCFFSVAIATFQAFYHGNCASSLQGLGAILLLIPLLIERTLHASRSQLAKSTGRLNYSPYLSWYAQR